MCVYVLFFPSFAKWLFPYHRLCNVSTVLTESNNLKVSIKWNRKNGKWLTESNKFQLNRQCWVNWIIWFNYQSLFCFAKESIQQESISMCRMSISVQRNIESKYDCRNEQNLSSIQKWNTAMECLSAVFAYSFYLIHCIYFRIKCVQKSHWKRNKRNN